jgi:hypothetical protein
MRARIAFAVMILMVVASIEASAQGKRLIFREGMTSCGSCTQARQTSSLERGPSMKWVAGYLSGEGGANVDATEPEALSVRRRRCRSHQASQHRPVGALWMWTLMFGITKTARSA